MNNNMKSRCYSMMTQYLADHIEHSYLANTANENKNKNKNTHLTKVKMIDWANFGSNEGSFA